VLGRALNTARDLIALARMDIIRNWFGCSGKAKPGLQGQLKRFLRTGADSPDKAVLVSTPGRGMNPSSAPARTHQETRWVSLLGALRVIAEPQCRFSVSVPIIGLSSPDHFQNQYPQFLPAQTAGAEVGSRSWGWKQAWTFVPVPSGVGAVQRAQLQRS
jgi:hypothetical protein